MTINKKIFRDNDIRGVYPSDFGEETAYAIGQGIAVMYKPERVAIGRDMRESGPKLCESMTDGLLSAGVDVIYLGMITTPMSYFASVTMDVDLSLIVSASHNPKEYNGLIISKRGGEASTKEELQRLAEISASEKRLENDKEGEETSKTILGSWIEHVFSIVDKREIRPMKAVFDAGNSVAGIALNPALEKLPQIEPVRMYFEPDGSFPHHIPNPLLSETLVDLQARVVKEEAALGLAYDGDSDRVIMVDEKGVIVTGSMMTAFLAKFLLTRRKYVSPPKCLYTSVMSRVVVKTVEKYGGRSILAPVGHSQIKQVMRTEDALFAGEHSGHFYFKENHYADSALVATLMLLAAVSSDERPVSAQMEEFRGFAQNEEVSIKVTDRDSFIAQMVDYLNKDTKLKPKDIIRFDGVTFDYDDYWFNLRPSGTEPVVRLNIESYDPDKLEVRVQEILKVVKELGGNV